MDVFISHLCYQITASVTVCSRDGGAGQTDEEDKLQRKRPLCIEVSFYRTLEVNELVRSAS